MRVETLLEKFGMYITNIKPPVKVRQGEMEVFSFKRMFPAREKIEIGKYQISLFIGQGMYYIPKDMVNSWTGFRGQWVVADFTEDQKKAYLGSAILQSFILRDGKYYEESIEQVKIGWELFLGEFHKMGHLGAADARLEDIRMWQEEDGTYRIYDSRKTAAKAFKYMIQKTWGYNILTKDNFIIEPVKNPVRGLWPRDGAFVIGSGQKLGIRDDCRKKVDELAKSLASKDKPKTQQELPLEGAEELVAAGVQV